MFKLFLNVAFKEMLADSAIDYLVSPWNMLKIL
jgi:hypothetical protein